MRKLVILLFGIIQLHNCYADAGNAYRYKIDIQLNNSMNLIGYVYHYTYGEPYNSKTSSFCDYFTSNFNNSPILYKEIKTLKLNESSEIDFALSTNKISFDIEEIQNVFLINEIEFPVGDRIHTLESKIDYQYLRKEPLNIDTVYKDWMENCSIILINWSKNNNISELKSRIIKDVSAFYDAKNEIFSNEISSYYSNLKKELSIKKIIFVHDCEAL